MPKSTHNTARTAYAAWHKVLRTLRAILAKLKANDVHDPFFRGQCDASWGLRPGLGRRRFPTNIENRLYFDFASLGSHLIPKGSNTWDILFLMQHHGLPTRLLDWTESFAMAMFFAIKKNRKDRPAAVWVLDPYELNLATAGQEVVDYLDSMYPIGYEKYFVDDRHSEFGTFGASALAVAGKPRNQRMIAQRGVFTIQKDVMISLDTLAPAAFHKISVPPEARPAAAEFLVMSGINEFAMFPDLDGLSRYLFERERSKRTWC